VLYGLRRGIDIALPIDDELVLSVCREACCIRAPCGDHVGLSVWRTSVFGGEEHRIDAELLDGVGGNRKPNIGLLRLVYKVSRADTVEREVIVIEAAAGEADAALIASACIHRARCQSRQRGPVSSIERQIPHLFELCTGPECVRRLVQLRGQAGSIQLLRNAAYRERDIERPCVTHGLLKVVEDSRLETGR